MNMGSEYEEIIRSRIKTTSGKEFQRLFWKIMLCHYPDLVTPEMQHDLGNDGCSIKEKTFFAVYSPESSIYDNSETSKKISNQNPKDLGDYEKFSQSWNNGQFTKWYFVTRDNLKGKPIQKLVELNNIQDGVEKIPLGLEQLVKFALDLDDKDKIRIFNLPQAENNTQNSFLNNGQFNNCNVYGADKIFIGDSPHKNNCNEAETIIQLIDYISSHSELEPDDLDSVMPDPDGKIYNRFASYCKEIEDEIKECAYYAKAQKEAEMVVGLDKIKIGKITAYLKRLSRKILRENNNNPMASLDGLTSHFEDILNKDGKKCDQNAIRYYLIGEIPKCNVFPN